MIGFLGTAYLWVKAAHIIFVIFWMAGLFMLPRFLAYHAETPEGSPERAAWAEREARLIRIILNPSMTIVWVLGLMLAFDTGAFWEGWFIVKFAAVIGLSWYQGWMTGIARAMGAAKPGPSGRTLRLLNEVPGVVAAIIVIMVIVRPF